MDTLLAIASKRDRRRYAARPISPEDRLAILDAGRLTGSAHNGQPWTFLDVRSPGVRAQVAAAVFRPQLVFHAALVIVIAVEPRGRMFAFDAGRAAQNMMLAAWDLGIGSCPNGIGDPDAMASALALAGDRRALAVLSFGHPLEPRDPGRRSAAEWSARADRRPLDELVREL